MIVVSCLRFVRLPQPVRAAGLADYPLAYNALPVRTRVDEQISQVMDDR